MSRALSLAGLACLVAGIILAPGPDGLRLWPLGIGATLAAVAFWAAAVVGRR